MKTRILQASRGQIHAVPTRGAVHADERGRK